MFSRRISATVELRILEERHAQAAAEVVLRNKDRLAEWLPWAEHHHTVDDISAFIQRGLEQFSRNEGFHCGIWCDGDFAGAAGIHTIDWANRNTSIGYWLDQNYEGRGIVTACCRALLDYLFHDLGLERVEIRCGVGNTRSSAIPLRLGFRHEGVLRSVQRVRGHYLDLNVYGILRREWSGG